MSLNTCFPAPESERLMTQSQYKGRVGKCLGIEGLGLEQEVLGNDIVLLGLILVGSYSVFVLEMVMGSFENLQHPLVPTVSFYMCFIIPILQISPSKPREGKMRAGGVPW